MRHKGWSPVISNFSLVGQTFANRDPRPPHLFRMLISFFTAVVWTSHVLPLRGVMEAFRAIDTIKDLPFPPLLLADILISQQTQQDSAEGEGFQVQLELDHKSSVVKVQLLNPVLLRKPLACQEIEILANGSKLDFYTKLLAWCAEESTELPDVVRETSSQVKEHYRFMLWRKMYGFHQRYLEGRESWPSEQGLLRLICTSPHYAHMMSLMEPPLRLPKSTALGKGGFGRVYKANWPGIGDVAVKIIRFKKESDTLNIAREIEATMAMSENTHFVKMHRAQMGSLDSVLLVMEVLSGKSGKVISDRQPSPFILAAISRSLLEGLHALNEEAGYIDQDLKPDNIQLTDEGEVKILDLGMARKLADPNDHKRRAGTPKYMPPETCHHSLPMTRACDVWTVGSTLYHWATGSFTTSLSRTRSGDELAQVTQQLARYVKRVDMKDQKQAKRLAAFVKLCLKLKPEERSSIPSLLADPFITNGVSNVSLKDWIQQYQKQNIQATHDSTTEVIQLNQ